MPGVSSEVTGAFRALSDPVRWKIVCGLAAGAGMEFGRLEEIVDTSRSVLGYHLRILVQAGLVEVRRDGRAHVHSLRCDAVRGLLGHVCEIDRPARTTPRTPTRGPVTVRGAEPPDHDDTEPVLLTW